MVINQHTISSTMRQKNIRLQSVSAVQSLSDEQLMQALQQGDLNKAAILFERYQKWIYNFFLRLTADRSLSEDLSQTVFERMIRYKSSYKNGFSFKTWIFQIARNVRADYHKKNKQMFDQLVPINELEQASVLADKEMELEEQQQQLYRSLNALPEDQREILILTRFQKLKYQEVAQLLDCTEGAVKVKVHRAIKSLRELFFKTMF